MTTTADVVVTDDATNATVVVRGPDMDRSLRKSARPVVSTPPAATETPPVATERAAAVESDDRERAEETEREPVIVDEEPNDVGAPLMEIVDIFAAPPTESDP